MTYGDGHLQRAIGLDVGGTKIAAGVIDRDGTVVERLDPRPAPVFGRDAMVSALLAVIDELAARHRVDAVGIGAAGLIDWPEGRVRWSPNNGFDNLDLRAVLAERTGLPTVVDNDANVALWAEANVAGCVGIASDIAMLTIGTGLGGGLILSGELYRGATGIAAEIGHLLVDANSEEVCSCGRTGHWEALTSGAALGRAARRAAAQDPAGLLARLGGGAERVTALTVTEAAHRHDPAALALFADVGHWLGVGASMLTTLLDLDLVILGGGMSTSAEFFLDPMRAALERYVFAPEHRKLPSIMLARLGTEAGWIGAGMLSLHELQLPAAAGHRAGR